MEKIKNRSSSIKRYFILAVSLTMLFVFLGSAVTIYGCYRIQKWILPNSNEIWLQAKTILQDGTVIEATQRFKLNESATIGFLIPAGASQSVVDDTTEYTIEKIESSYGALTPKKKLCYQIMGGAMIVLPLLYSMIGIGVCAWWFYRRKLAPPIRILTDATEHISTQNLDFEVVYESADEMGQLCEAFEKMRQVLYENNRQLWNMIENRRTLQASVAHDLRNPIAIIEGYVEYMQQNIPNGNLSGEKLQHTLSNLAVTAKRLERYTDYIRDLHALEETDLHYSKVVLPDYLKDIADTFAVVANQHELKVSYECEIPLCQASIDKDLLYRILENIFTNAIRYAEKNILIFFELDHKKLSACIKDDGPGFSEQMLQNKARLFYSEDTSGEHMGLGLATSQVLCQKHGGNMELFNTVSHGACIKVTISLESETEFTS